MPRGRQSRWVQPEFGDLLIPLNVDVAGLRPLVAVEEESKGTIFARSSARASVLARDWTNGVRARVSAGLHLSLAGSDNSSRVIRRNRLHAFARRFSEALEYAAKKHATQLRKGTRIPYVSHVMAAASLVLEHGGGEDEAIAALLHDIPEDCGGRAALDEIRGRFGKAVARIVEGCKDSFEKPKPPWRRRKEKYLAHLATASKSVLLVSAADKVHNARSILSDYREQGEKLWKRFNAGSGGQLWYYRQLVKAFRARGSSPLVDELDRVVTELERLTRRPRRRTAAASRR